MRLQESRSASLKTPFTEIYETYIINEFKAKYNVDKVFFK